MRLPFDCRAPIAFALAFFVAATGVRAEIVLRATGDHLSDEAITYIARNARPTRIAARQFKDPEKLTYRNIVETRCGEVKDAYVTVLREFNGLEIGFDLDKPIGSVIDLIAWPACLRWISLSPSPKAATERDAFIFMVDEGDQAAAIRQYLTGLAAPKTLEHFFAARNGKPIKTSNDLSMLQPGDQLLVEHRTFPVEVEPIRRLSEQEFIDGLKATINIADRPGHLNAKYVEDERYRDEIIIVKTSPVPSIHEAPSIRPTPPTNSLDRSEMNNENSLDTLWEEVGSPSQLDEVTEFDMRRSSPPKPMVVHENSITIGQPQSTGHEPRSRRGLIRRIFGGRRVVATNDAVSETQITTREAADVGWAEGSAIETYASATAVLADMYPTVNILGAQERAGIDPIVEADREIKATLVAGELASDNMKFCEAPFYELDGQPKDGAIIANKDQVLSVLELAKNTGKSENYRSNVLVIDNGFLGTKCTNIPEDEFACKVENGSNGHGVVGDNFQPKEYFSNANWRRRKKDSFDVPFGPTTNSEMGGFASLYLQSAVTGDNSPLKKKMPFHGTHVASLLLGGVWLGRDGRETVATLFNVRAPYQLVVVNIGNGGAEVTVDFADEVNTIIFDTLNKLRPRRIDIINTSFTLRHYERTWARLEDGLHRIEKDALIVAAAGNSGREVTDSKPFASVGGNSGVEQFPRQVLTVASHDADNNLSIGSNHGADWVDIAAPGCGVYGWTNGNGKGASLNGTSQAAPIASQAAALIKFLTGWTSKEIKQRIYISGDFDVSYREKIASSSRLNFAKSLYVFHDYVRIYAPSLKAGENTEIELLGWAEDWAGQTPTAAPCKNSNEAVKIFKNISSIKRDSAQQIYTFTDSSSTQSGLSLCELELTEDVVEQTFLKFKLTQESLASLNAATASVEVPETGEAEVTTPDSAEGETVRKDEGNSVRPGIVGPDENGRVEIPLWMVREFVAASVDNPLENSNRADP